MKKLLVLILCLTCAFTFVACESNDVNEKIDASTISVGEQLVDEVFGYKIEMAMPLIFQEDGKIEKTVTEDSVNYSFYDKENESDGGFVLGLSIRNDYPDSEDVNVLNEYEDSFKNVGQTKILYGIPGETFFAYAHTASDVPYDITSEEKTAHYQDMLASMQLASETFNATIIE